MVVVVGQEMTMPPTQSGSTRFPLPMRLPELEANNIVNVPGFEKSERTRGGFCSSVNWPSLTPTFRLHRFSTRIAINRLLSIGMAPQSIPGLLKPLLFLRGINPP